MSTIPWFISTFSLCILLAINIVFILWCFEFLKLTMLFEVTSESNRL